MEQAVETLRLALRVLMAIIDRRCPEPHDVAALQRLAPSGEPTPLDELACDLIQKAVQQRATARAAGAGS